ncbi:hypothetical protein [Aureibacillus halotolerans]|uniref:Lincosamide nucleotidyltransferase-like C-terminal domain-containing protein n=1 Tax=Aureibacillus halotolerans TaxID=1508390 RepID=A0A4R6U5M7_9BACI|nr:hypothetical protein [Aureibacillus halotolerans]TDQ41056.1 hypothetical protein EV213_10453 [Aureibacillus halotolerans]
MSLGHRYTSVKHMAEKDGAIEAMFMYDMFTSNKTRHWADCKFHLLVPNMNDFSKHDWLGQLSPVALQYEENGKTVVLFEHLGRAEFHFYDQHEPFIGKYVSMKRSFNLSLQYDNLGILSLPSEAEKHSVLSKDIQLLFYQWIDSWIVGMRSFQYGEHARSMAILCDVRASLVQIARILNQATIDGEDPYQNIEKDLTDASYTRLRATTARLQPEEIRAGYIASWRWGKDMFTAMAPLYNVIIDPTFMKKTECMMNVKTPQ